MLGGRAVAPGVSRRPARASAFLNLPNLLGGAKSMSTKGAARRSELKEEVRGAGAAAGALRGRRGSAARRARCAPTRGAASAAGRAPAPQQRQRAR
jgi:hypothetical protein